MKKSSLAILLLLMIFSLAACGNGGQQPTNTPDASTPPSASQPVEESTPPVEPTDAPDATDAPEEGGKTVVPFVTSGGSGFSGTVSAIEAAEPGATLLDGLSLSGDSVDSAGDEITAWLDGLSLN